MVVKPTRRAAIGIALGLAVVGSVAFAASLGVTTSKITTSNSSVSIPPEVCTPAPAADAALDEETPNSNYGTLEFLAVRSRDRGRDRRSIVRFDIASCGIPSTAVIRSSDLTVVPSSGPASGRTYDVHRVTASWVEGSVTFSNAPSFAGSPTASANTGVSPTSISWSVTSDVSAFVTGTVNHGWLIKDAVENSRTAVESVLGSRESAAGIRPTLTITYYR